MRKFTAQIIAVLLVVNLMAGCSVAVQTLPCSPGRKAQLR